MKEQFAYLAKMFTLFFHGRQSLIYLEGLQTSIGDQVVPAAFER